MFKNMLPPKQTTRWFAAFIFFIFLILSSSQSFATPNGEGIQIYQKNVHLSPEHKQKLADDISRYRNADNLWDVLREEFTLPHYEDNPAVQAKIEWFMNNQDFLLRSTSRAAPYLYYILQQVKKRHLPAELVLLPIIESGYNPFNRSPVGAVGIWQLMPATASDLGVKQDGWYDGRRDVIASTRAALNYLAYLQSFFEGNWLYAIAAYNTGEGNVLSAIKRNIREGRDTDFWLLPVAQQTKDYVPSLLALAVIISRPNQYPIYLPPVRNASYLAEIDVGREIHLTYAASLAGISYKQLLQLNPAFNRTSTSPSKKGPKKLVLPIENVEQFTENLSQSPLSKPINWTHYKVKSGDTLASIARQFNTTVNAIRKLNHLSKTNLRHGANLLIPDHADRLLANNETTDESADEPITTESITPKEKIKKIKIATQSHPRRIENRETWDLNKLALQKRPSATTDINLPKGKYTLQPGDTIYMVRAKDTLESIAKRFQVSSKLLQAANQLKGKSLQPGKQLIIPTHFTSVELASSQGLQPGDTLYMVRKGDTIEKIARRFNTTPAAIRLANLVDETSLVEGEKLVVPTHLRG